MLIVRMAVCARSVVFRDVAVTLGGCKASRYHQEIATRGTIYDMDIDASDELVVTVGQVSLLRFVGRSCVHCLLQITSNLFLFFKLS
jgi:hypothetical protein